jgi:hypothetical protein
VIQDFNPTVMADETFWLFAKRQPEPAGLPVFLKWERHRHVQHAMICDPYDRNPANPPLHSCNSAKSVKAEMLSRLRQIVEMESPSSDKSAVDRLSAFLAAEFERRGGKVKFHREEKYADHLQVEFLGQDAAKPVLLLGHL